MSGIRDVHAPAHFPHARRHLALSRRSTVAGPVDWLFYFILYISTFFFFLILVLLIVFSWKYRYQPGKVQPDAPKHSTALELTWTFIPTVIVIVIFYYGFKQYLNLAVPRPTPTRSP